MLMQTKTCRNCKYFQPNQSWFSHQYRISYGQCTHPISQNINLVSGVVSYQDASTQRQQQENNCGPQGTYYLPEPNTLKLILREVYWPETVLHITLICCVITMVIKALT